MPDNALQVPFPGALTPRTAELDDGSFVLSTAAVLRFLEDESLTAHPFYAHMKLQQREQLRSELKKLRRRMAR